MQGLLIPTMIFQNTDKAMEWSTTDFAIRTHLVVQGEAGAVVHAQLVLGDAMISLGQAGTKMTNTDGLIKHRRE